MLDLYVWMLRLVLETAWLIGSAELFAVFAAVLLALHLTLAAGLMYIIRRIETAEFGAEKV